MGSQRAFLQLEPDLFSNGCDRINLCSISSLLFYHIFRNLRQFRDPDFPNSVWAVILRMETIKVNGLPQITEYNIFPVPSNQRVDSVKVLAKKQGQAQGRPMSRPLTQIVITCRCGESITMTCYLLIAMSCYVLGMAMTCSLMTL